MREPKDLVATIEQQLMLPPGESERFGGYGVMALPFRSGHLLALRRFPSSSLGPAYTAIWHRDPAGRWSIHATVAPQLSCSRYFGAELAESGSANISILWTGPRECQVEMDSPELVWQVRVQSTSATRLLNAVSSLMPASLWQSKPVLSAMGRVAGLALQAGRVGLHGRASNGQWFIANPRHIWIVTESAARLRGTDLGPIGPLREQSRLGDFWLPQRGVFAIGQSYFEPFSADRHLTTYARTANLDSERQEFWERKAS